MVGSIFAKSHCAVRLKINVMTLMNKLCQLHVYAGKVFLLKHLQRKDEIRKAAQLQASCWFILLQKLSQSAK